MRPLLALLTFAWLCLPGLAHAVDGFQDLKFGMTPAQARAAYPEQLRAVGKVKGAPDDAVGDALVMRGARLFEQKVDVFCFFNQSGLSIIRLNFLSPKAANVQKLMDFYEPHWGAPIRTSNKLSATKRKRTWAWAWEGVDLREVVDDNEVKYQRIDYSEAVRTRWTTADTSICTILPSSSTCPFPDSFCPASHAGDRREMTFPIGDTEGTIRCTYESGALTDVRLTVEKPDPLAADWVERILARRLGGEGRPERREGSSEILEDSHWDSKGVQLRVVRKAKVRTKEGWTGPVQYIRIKRGN